MLPIKILLFTADDSIKSSMITCLEQAGYQVIPSSHGAGAIDLIHLENPALIIIDLELPDFNSMAIIRLLRIEGLNDHTPVILIGSNMREEDALIALEIGADFCMLETFHPQVFVARVRSLLRRTEPIRIH